MAIVTPLIDGMNLVAKEFVACQQEEPGTLILSEFAGAAEELFSALIVNPYDASAVARAIREALEMPVEDRRLRMEPMRRRVMTHDARAWAGRFIEDLRSRNGHAPPAPDLGEARAAIRRSGRRATVHAARQHDPFPVLTLLPARRPGRRAASEPAGFPWEAA